MKWFNLKKNKCPKCGKDLMFGLGVPKGMLMCNCGFKISEKRCKEIVTKTVESDLEMEVENE